jgi:hypothetical protein
MTGGVWGVCGEIVIFAISNYIKESDTYTIGMTVTV